MEILKINNIMTNLKTKSNENLDSTGIDDRQGNIGIPFHLSTSQNYRQKTGFTNSLGSESISYDQMTSLAQFAEVVRHDVAGSEFTNNYRGKQNFLRSDVLVFDVDNDGQDQNYWDNPNNWLSITKFEQLFADYEWLIATSFSHQQEKKERSARDRFHVFMPLGSFVNWIDEYEKLLRGIQLYVARGYEQLPIDTAVGGYSMIFGNANTQIRYNSGQNIMALLQTVIDQDQSELESSSLNFSPVKQLGHQQQQDYSDFLNSWDYKNVISRFGLDEFYPTIDSRHNGYWMAKCDLHDDQNPSLMVYDNGGFKCLSPQCRGNQQSSWSALDYLALKQDRTKVEIRREYCQRLNLDYNRYLIEENCSQSEGYPEGYVPITNIGHVTIPAADYTRLAEINREHAVCSIEGGSCILWYTHTSFSQKSDQNHKAITYQSEKDFQAKFKNDFVQSKWLRNETEDGVKTWTTKAQPLGKLWLEWDQRREYDRAHFHPAEKRIQYMGKRVWDYFDDWDSASQNNNWLGEENRRGLIRFLKAEKYVRIESLGQAEDMCSLYLDHIENNLCGNYSNGKRQQLYNYIICWMASALTRHLDDRTTVGLVLQSGQGSGKGLFASSFGELFGHYFLHLTDSNRLTQKFNLQMKDRLLVFADEVLFGGDKKSIGVLKTMQTEDTFTVEPKGVNAFIVNNHRRFIYSSNEQWIIHKETDDRRYQVIDVKNKKMSGETYKQIRQQLNDGGREALYYLLTSAEIQERIEDYDFEANMVSTKAGIQQMIQSEPVLGWFHEILDNGGHDELVHGKKVIKEWKPFQPNAFSTEKDALYDSFVRYMETHGGKRYTGGKPQLSNKLSKLHEQGIIQFDAKKRDGKTATNITVWSFEGIQEARKRWDTHFNDGEDSFNIPEYWKNF